MLGLGLEMEVTREEVLTCPIFDDDEMKLLHLVLILFLYVEAETAISEHQFFPLLSYCIYKPNLDEA